VFLDATFSNQRCGIQIRMVAGFAEVTESEATLVAEAGFEPAVLARRYASVKAKEKQMVPGARFAPHVAQSLAYPSPPLHRTLRDVKQKCEAESCRRESSSAPFQTAPLMPS
jgi:hypothetical protein